MSSLNLNQTMKYSNFWQSVLPIQIILIILTIFTNLSILLTILFKIKVNKYSHNLFLSIAMSDLIVGCVSMPFMTLLNQFSHWPSTNRLCLIWIIVDYSSATISLLSILLLTIQRYCLIKNPYRTKETLTIMKLLIIMWIWIFTFIYWIISVLTISNMNGFDYLNCYLNYKWAYILFSDLIGFGIPIILIIFFSILTIIELKNKTNNKSDEQMIDENVKTIRSNKMESAYWCIVLVFLNIFFSWLFFVIIWPINSYCNGCIDFSIMYISGWIGYLASFNNSIIMFIFNSTIRDNFFKILKGQK